MKKQIEYLKSQPQISDVLAKGFAQIFHLKPQFPVTFLAQYLKNHNQLKDQRTQIANTIARNQEIAHHIREKEVAEQKKQEEVMQESLKRKERQEGFEFKVQECYNHQDFLSQFCEWIEKEKNFTGVYIGQLEQPFKDIDLDREDSQEAHLDGEAPKVIKFKAASHSHHALMIGKTLSQESVLGRLLQEKVEEGENEEEGKREDRPKGEVYVSQVQENKELHFFKYPRLGSFFGVTMKLKSYVSQKVFDANIVKAESFRKIKEDFEKEVEEREAKFRQLYDQKAGSGAEEKELEEMEKAFEKEEEAFPKPQLQDYEFVLRQFVVCFDTLGKDRQITQSERQHCRKMVDLLRESWESKEKGLLQKDIDSQLKQNTENSQNPLQEVLVRLIEEEDKDLPSNEEVEKVKANEKLVELEINTLRIDKIKQYIEEEKNASQLETLLERRVIKFPEIVKIFMIFAGHRKEDITYPGTNVLNWLKARQILSKQSVHKAITEYNPRGAKPDVKVLPYAKWERILKCLDKYDQNTVASYNIFMAFILRFLQLSGKVRLADREARKLDAKAARQAREEKIKEAELKGGEKAEKLQAAKTEAEEKNEEFDEEAWLRAYEEENPQIEIGEQIVEEVDADLEEEAGEPQS